MLLQKPEGSVQQCSNRPAAPDSTARRVGLVGRRGCPDL